MLELSVCREYKIPHGFFLGGPLVWSQSDRDKAIWQYIREKEKCPNCNTREAEWDPLQGGDRQAYGVRTARCRGCEVKEMFPEAQLKALGKGAYIYLGKNRNAN